MITNILTYIDGYGSAENAAEAAFHLAIRHNAHVEGLFFRADAEEFIKNVPHFGNPSAYDQFAETYDRNTMQAETRATEAFAQVRDKFAVSEGDAASSTVRPTAHWSVGSGQPEQIVCQLARVNDVCVIGRGSNGSKNSTGAVIEAVLFDSGRPVLIAPPQPPKSVGSEIIITWNRSAMAARALNTAMPLFDKADRIRLIYVDTGAKAGPSVEAAATYVERHGFNVETETVRPHSGGVGSTLLHYAQNADLLVMGSYSHSRLREVILGGVTRYVLANAEVPVLMVH
jgi:nucleotide-binding universal stress UspA family protein